MVTLTGGVRSLGVQGVILSLVVGCGSAPPPGETTPAGPPRIHFAETEIDLGDVAVSNSGHTQRFTVTNRGLSPLTIDLLESDCACLDATISRRTLDPEQQAAVIVHLRTDEAGRRSTNLVVHSNDPAQPRVKLTASWRVRTPIEFVPDTLDFGIVRPATNVVVPHALSIPMNCGAYSAEMRYKVAVASKKIAKQLTCVAINRITSCVAASDAMMKSSL